MYFDCVSQEEKKERIMSVQTDFEKEFETEEYDYLGSLSRNIAQ